MLDYPSNITKEQFELIREDLESARKKTKPPKLDFANPSILDLILKKIGRVNTYRE